MDKYTIMEMHYKNGYSAGYADAEKLMRGTTEWIHNGSHFVCRNCGAKYKPDLLDAKYCPFCGRKIK